MHRHADARAARRVEHAHHRFTALRAEPTAAGAKPAASIDAPASAAYLNPFIPCLLVERSEKSDAPVSGKVVCDGGGTSFAQVTASPATDGRAHGGPPSRGFSPRFRGYIF